MNESSPPGRNDARREREATDSGAALDLDAAVRRARRDAADRARSNADAAPPASARRVGERERLEHLLAALTPVLRRIPKDADLFDVGVTQGFDRDRAEGRPRLFLDMIGYVECAPGGGFRLVQSTRHGRVALGEAADLAGASRLVCDYIARRLVEREQALAGDRAVEDAALRLMRREPALPRDEEPARWTRPDPTRETPPEPPPRRDAAQAAPAAPLAPAASPPRARPSVRMRFDALRARLRRRAAPLRARRGGAMERGLVFAVQFLGSAALTLIVALAAWWAWKAAGFVK